MDDLVLEWSSPPGSDDTQLRIDQLLYEGDDYLHAIEANEHTSLDQMELKSGNGEDNATRSITPTEDDLLKLQDFSESSLCTEDFQFTAPASGYDDQEMHLAREENVLLQQMLESSTQSKTQEGEVPSSRRMPSQSSISHQMLIENRSRNVLSSPMKVIPWAGDDDRVLTEMRMELEDDWPIIGGRFAMQTFDPLESRCIRVRRARIEHKESILKALELDCAVIDSVNSKELPPVLPCSIPEKLGTGFLSTCQPSLLISKNGLEHQLLAGSLTNECTGNISPNQNHTTKTCSPVSCTSRYQYVQSLMAARIELDEYVFYFPSDFMESLETEEEKKLWAEALDQVYGRHVLTSSIICRNKEDDSSSQRSNNG